MCYQSKSRVIYDNSKNSSYFTTFHPFSSNSQHHDTPNNKTHVIKFRVTAEEKTSLELTCKLLNLSLSTFIRRAIHNVKIEKTVIVAGGGEETLTAVSTLLAQCSKVGTNLSTAQTMWHLRVEVMELCEGAGLYQIDLLNGSKERVSEAEYWARRRGQLKLDRENAALTAAGQQPRQKKFETAKETLRKQISSVLYRFTSYEDFSDRLLQQ